MGSMDSKEHLMTTQPHINLTSIATYRRHTIHIEFAGDRADSVRYRIATEGEFDPRCFTTIAAACSAAKEG